jgi:CheY-like chemotaxis protein
MDINMPEMNGEEALKIIREFEKSKNLKKIPIIALTANSMEGDKERFLKIGFDNYLSKPIEIEKLLAIIGDYLIIDEINDSNFQEKSEIIENNIDYDFKTVSELIGVDEIFLTELIKDFEQDLKKTLPKLKEVIDEKNFNEIREISHRIKGASANLRLEIFTNIFQEMEEESKQQKDINYNTLLEKAKNNIKFLESILEL